MFKLGECGRCSDWGGVTFFRFTLIKKNRLTLRNCTPNLNTFFSCLVCCCYRQVSELRTYFHSKPRIYLQLFTDDESANILCCAVYDTQDVGGKDFREVSVSLFAIRCTRFIALESKLFINTVLLLLARLV